MPAVRDRSFNIFTAPLHIGGHSTIRNPRTHHAVVTGTHSKCVKPAVQWSLLPEGNVSFSHVDRQTVSQLPQDKILSQEMTVVPRGLC